MRATHTETIRRQMKTSEAGIFSRLFTNGHDKLSVTAARFILSLDFSDEDKVRVHELAVKNQESKLSPEEWQELENYMKVDTIISILQSKARMALKKKR